MERTIPSAILIKGISKEGLTNLLNDIEYAAIDEGIDIVNADAEKIIAIVREKKPGEETEEWVKRFKAQIAVLEKVTDRNISKIENLFERIFKDWEEYEKTNISVIDLEEVAQDENNDEVVSEKEEESVSENENNEVTLDDNLENEDVVLEESKEEIDVENSDEENNVSETQEVVENTNTVDEPEVELEIDIPVDHIEEDVDINEESNEEEKTEGEVNE